ncbi:MAG: type II toxin-antitoxin system VapC family toxin [Alphaproteobacteria bacterium]|nr:type II toxin-antitoxin system VapC family toxin [Alphaproteobacteria bacterium]
MILVDTSIWVDHLRRGDEKLAALLNDGLVLLHSFVIGELALGNLPRRKQVLDSLQDLPSAIEANDKEVLDFINRHALPGLGIGYVDAHLLAAARLNGVRLWTRDKRLREAAIKLGLAYGEGV